MAKYFFLLLFTGCLFRGTQQETETYYTVTRYEFIYRQEEDRVIIWMIDDYAKTLHTLNRPVKDTLNYPVGCRFKQLIKL